MPWDIFKLIGDKSVQTAVKVTVKNPFEESNISYQSIGNEPLTGMSRIGQEEMSISK